MTDTDVFHPNVPDVVPRELTYANPRQTVIIESWDEKILPEGRAAEFSFTGPSNAPVIPIYGQTGTAIDFQDSYIVVWLDASETTFDTVRRDTRALDVDSEDNPIAHPRNYNLVFSENVFTIFREIVIRNGQNAVLQRITDVNRIRSILDLCDVSPEERVTVDGTIAGFGPEEVHMKDFRVAFWKLRFKFNIGILDMEELYPIGLSSGLRIEFKLDDPAVYMRLIRQHRFQFDRTLSRVTNPTHPNAYDIRADLTRQGVGWDTRDKVGVDTARIFPLDPILGERFREYTCPFSHNANGTTDGGTFGTQGMHQSWHPRWKVVIRRFEAHIRYKRLSEDFWRAQLLSVERLNSEGFSGLAIPFKHYSTARREFTSASQLRFNPQVEEGNTDALIAGIRYARHERGDMNDFLKEGLFTLTPFIATRDLPTLSEANTVVPLDYVWKIGGESFPRNRVEFLIDPVTANGDPSIHELWRELKGSLCPRKLTHLEEVLNVGMLDKWSFASTAQAYPFWRYHQVVNEFAETNADPDAAGADSQPVAISLFPNTFGVHESAYGKAGSLFGSGVKTGTSPGRNGFLLLDTGNVPGNVADLVGLATKDFVATMSQGFSAPEPYISMFSRDLLEGNVFNVDYSVAKKVISAKNPHTFFCADLKKSRTERWFDGRTVTTASLAPQFEINFSTPPPPGIVYVLDTWAIQSKLLTFWPNQREVVFG